LFPVGPSSIVAKIMGFICKGLVGQAQVAFVGHERFAQKIKIT
jgi:hypothetical protein